MKPWLHSALCQKVDIFYFPKMFLGHFFADPILLASCISLRLSIGTWGGEEVGINTKTSTAWWHLMLSVWYFSQVDLSKHSTGRNSTTAYSIIIPQVPMIVCSPVQYFVLENFHARYCSLVHSHYSIFCLGSILLYCSYYCTISPAYSKDMLKCLIICRVIPLYCTCLAR